MWRFYFLVDLHFTVNLFFTCDEFGYRGVSGQEIITKYGIAAAATDIAVLLGITSVFLHARVKALGLQLSKYSNESTGFRFCMS